jgi:methyl-accepting chemotaxis protein
MSTATTGKSVSTKTKTNGQSKTNNRVKTNGHEKSDYLNPKMLLSKKGDFTSRLPDDEVGITGKIYDALNEIIEKNEQLTAELARISEVVGREGKIAQRAALNHATGGWASCISSVNTLITDLAQPTTEVARVIGAVAEGDLSQNFNLEIDGRPLKGEFLRTGKTVNTMRQARRAGAGQRRLGNVEGSDR